LNFCLLLSIKRNNLLQTNSILGQKGKTISLQFKMVQNQYYTHSTQHSLMFLLIKCNSLLANQHKFRAKSKNDKFTIQNGAQSIVHTFKADFAFVFINNTQQPTKKRTILSENVNFTYSVVDVESQTHFLQRWPGPFIPFPSGSKCSDSNQLTTWPRCYKTFFVRDLRIFVVS